MNVSNIRFGFATNSSSTHSIVINKNLNDDYIEGEYGWNEFCLASNEAKKLYLGQTLYDTLKQNIGNQLAKCVVHDLLAVDPDDDGYVDHQSFMSLPLHPKYDKPDLEFFSELVEYYLNPNIAIVGGNDNKDGDYELYPESIRQPHILPVDERLNLVCRKDKDWWVLQNKITGTKIRLSFKDNAEPYTKSTAPELIDLKITNQCLNHCEYCYQNSDIDGKHAKYENIYDIICTLGKNKVLELAIGGGEPTLHPRFTDIIDIAHYTGMLVNFTTRDLKWVYNSLITNTVENYVSRFGISVNYGNDITNALDIIPKNLHDKVYFQYVINTGSLSSLLENDRLYPHPLIILGFKTTGRGKSYKPFKNADKDWIKTIKEHYGTYGIDTALAEQYKNEVEDNFNKLLVQYDEGKFSMYIDAVEMKAGKCSYADDYTPINDKTDLMELFTKY